MEHEVALRFGWTHVGPIVGTGTGLGWPAMPAGAGGYCFTLRLVTERVCTWVRPISSFPCYAQSDMLSAMGNMKAASLLREARTAAGLSQMELAQKAGVTQSVISVYEAGRRQPSVPTLTALIAATGYELDLSIGRPRRGVQRLTGPVGRGLRRRRSEVLELADRHGVQVLGVFGSVARGEDRPDSDIDLLVELPAGMGLFAVARVQNELEELLSAPVDLIPESGLKAGVRQAVEADLVRL